MSIDGIDDITYVENVTVRFNVIENVSGIKRVVYKYKIDNQEWSEEISNTDD